MIPLNIPYFVEAQTFLQVDANLRNFCMFLDLLKHNWINLVN